MQNSTSRFWTALTKTNHKSIQENGIDDEAKAAVPFTVHEQIAKAMLRQGDFVSWTYLILQWNLLPTLLPTLINIINHSSLLLRVFKYE